MRTFVLRVPGLDDSWWTGFGLLLVALGLFGGVSFHFMYPLPPSLQELHRLDGAVVGKVEYREPGRGRPYVRLDVWFKTYGILGAVNDFEGLNKHTTDQMIPLRDGDTVGVWFAPRGPTVNGRTEIWQLHHEGRAVVTYAQLHAARISFRHERIGVLAFMCALGISLLIRGRVRYRHQVEHVRFNR